MFPSPHSAFSFTNLSRLILEIFTFFEKHAQNLNTPQNNSASWDLEMGLNSVFKGLKYIFWFYSMTHLWFFMNGKCNYHETE
jgi:hypothetical protein